MNRTDRARGQLRKTGFPLSTTSAPRLPRTGWPWPPCSGAQLPLSLVPATEGGRAWVSHRGDETEEKSLRALSLPQAGSCGLLQRVVAMQPCLFKASLEESRSHQQQAVAAQHLSREEAGPGLWGWARARAGQAWGLPGPRGSIGSEDTKDPGFLWWQGFGLWTER